MTGRTEQAEKDRQNRTGKQDRPKRTGGNRTGRNRTGGTGQAE